MEATPSLLARLRWALPLLVSLALFVPGVFADHYNDDWTLRVIAEGRAPGFDNSPWRLFEFTRSQANTTELIATGSMPWWTEPSLRLRFFRPLSSLLFALDVRVLGPSPTLAHVHSLLWIVALLWLTGRWFERVLPARTARVAWWLVALSPHLVNGALWASARNGVSASVCVMAALLLQARAHAQQRPAPIAKLLALFVIGLCFGELALGFVPLFVAMEWARGAHPTARSLLRSASPVVVSALVYLGLYVALGFGAGGSGLYLDPVRDFSTALREAPLRLGVLVLDGLYTVPSELYLMLPGARVGIAVVALSTLALLLAWLHRSAPTRDREAHRTLLAVVYGSLCALAPGLLGIPGGRLLTVAIVGFAALLAAWVDRALEARAQRRAWAWAALAIVAVVRLALGGLLRVGASAQLVKVSRDERRVAATASFRCPKNANFVLVDGADPVLGMYAAPAMAYLDPAIGGTFRTLSMQLDTLVLTRTGERSFSLEPEHGGTLTDFVFAEVFRRPASAMRAGDVVRTTTMSATVERVRDGRPQRVNFRFDAPFDGGQTCVLRWRAGRVESFDLPPIGQSMRVAHERGPLGI